MNKMLGGSPHHLNFRVKFFVSDPNKLQEEYTWWVCGFQHWCT